MNDIETYRESKEMKCFAVVQKCHCGNGAFESIKMKRSAEHEKRHIHECTGCGKLKAFRETYPRIEYEEVEVVKSETGEYKFDADAFDDDIPF